MNMQCGIYPNISANAIPSNKNVVTAGGFQIYCDEFSVGKGKVEYFVRVFRSLINLSTSGVLPIELLYERVERNISEMYIFSKSLSVSVWLYYNI